MSVMTSWGRLQIELQLQMSELSALCQSLAGSELSTVYHVGFASQLLSQGAMCQMCICPLGARSCTFHVWNEQGAVLGGVAVPYTSGLDQRRLE